MMAYMMAHTRVEVMLLGVSVMFLGGIMLSGKFKGRGAILLVAGVCIGIGGYLARDMPNGSPVMVALGFLGIAAVILMFVLDNKKNAAAKKEAAQKQAAEVIEATMLDRFFVECVLSEADDFQSPRTNKGRSFWLTNTT